MSLNTSPYYLINKLYIYSSPNINDISQTKMCTQMTIKYEKIPENKVLTFIDTTKNYTMESSSILIHDP